MDEYLGMIKIFAGNFAPRTFAFCQGQLIAISSNTALFALLGTTYGGNGTTTFGLPDFRGRIPIHNGYSQGPGLSAYLLGQRAGTENVQLTINNLPSHTHAIGLAAPGALSTAGTVNTPVNTAYANSGTKRNYSSVDDSLMAPLTVAIGAAGNSQSVSIVQPALVMNYVITTSGLFPSRN